MSSMTVMKMKTKAAAPGRRAAWACDMEIRLESGAAAQQGVMHAGSSTSDGARHQREVCEHDGSVAPA
jgi:hypothetical protein